MIISSEAIIIIKVNPRRYNLEVVCVHASFDRECKFILNLFTVNYGKANVNPPFPFYW